MGGGGITLDYEGNVVWAPEGSGYRAGDRYDYGNEYESFEDFINAQLEGNGEVDDLADLKANGHAITIATQGDWMWKMGGANGLNDAEIWQSVYGLNGHHSNPDLIHAGDLVVLDYSEHMPAEAAVNALLDDLQPVPVDEQGNIDPNGSDVNATAIANFKLALASMDPEDRREATILAVGRSNGAVTSDEMSFDAKAESAEAIEKDIVKAYLEVAMEEGGADQAVAAAQELNQETQYEAHGVLHQPYANAIEAAADELGIDVNL